MKSCGSCFSCCTGTLIGNAYGNEHYPTKPCVFLVNNKCSIYETRPAYCQKYQCAWSQDILSDLMQPDKCGVIISVEIDKSTNKQFLRCSGILTDTIKTYLNEWCENNNTYYK